MSKTKPTFKKTKFGILSVREIEAGITDNLANVRAYVLRNYETMIIGIDLAKDLHLKLAGNLFDEAGDFRKKEVSVGDYEPPVYFKLPEMMKNWEEDFNERARFVKNENDHIEVLAWMMHKFLWVYPFFDYNGRVARLLGEIYLLKNNLPAITFMGIKRNDFAKAMKEATDKNSLDGISKIIKKNLIFK